MDGADEQVSYLLLSIPLPILLLLPSLRKYTYGVKGKLINSAPYNYNPLIIGVVILSFGAGNMVGSVAGGKWSDVYLRRLREANNGVSVPEVCLFPTFSSILSPHMVLEGASEADNQMRLKGTLWFMPLLVASFLTYAWTAGSHVNIAGIIISLFFAGLSVMLIYASTLAYLVDVNPVRSSFFFFEWS
jgi:MFS family permease